MQDIERYQTIVQIRKYSQTRNIKVQFSMYKLYFTEQKGQIRMKKRKRFKF